MFFFGTLTKTLSGKLAATAATALLGVGVAAAAHFSYPVVVKSFIPWQMGESIKVDLMFKRNVSGLPADIWAYWQTRDQLKSRGSASYLREIGEDIYQDFDRQRFIADGTIPSSAFENGRPADGAVSYTFGIFLRNNTDQPIVFELGGFRSNDEGVKNWHTSLLWYNGPDNESSTGKDLEIVADSNKIFLERQAGGRYVFPGEPVLPGEFMALELNVLNKSTTGENDRYILAKLKELIRTGARIDPTSLTAQLRSTIAVYKVAEVEGGEGFDRVRVDMVLDTKPDDVPNYMSPLLAISKLSDVGELGVKLHFVDGAFWDRILRKLGSSLGDFMDSERPSAVVTDDKSGTNPISDFRHIITDDGTPLGGTVGGILIPELPDIKDIAIPGADANLKQAPFTEDDLATFLRIANEVFYPSGSETGAERLKEMIQLKDGNLYVNFTGQTADTSVLPWWLRQYLERYSTNWLRQQEVDLFRQWQEVAYKLKDIPKFCKSAGRIYIYVGYSLPAEAVPTRPWMPLWPSNSSTPFNALLLFYESSRVSPD